MSAFAGQEQLVEQLLLESACEARRRQSRTTPLRGGTAQPPIGRRYRSTQQCAGGISHRKKAPLTSPARFRDHRQPVHLARTAEGHVLGRPRTSLRPRGALHLVAAIRRQTLNTTQHSSGGGCARASASLRITSASPSRSSCPPTWRARTGTTRWRRPCA